MCVVAACVAERGPFTNRMAQSATSYLARAARQPVDWQPWSRDAFALAAKLDRPVLLYIGGDACHWCTETDRAIYTDPEIGSLINALFVPVRVDRDERPDVARRYQVAVERLAGLQGWPLTVFLTADGGPFFGGTYFPADDPITGRGLKQILPEVARSYRENRAFVIQHAALVRQLAAGDPAHGVLQRAPLQAEIARLRTELSAALAGGPGEGGGTRLSSVMHVEAVSVLLAEFARENDSTALATARAALDLFLEPESSRAATTAGAPGGVRREDPPRLVQAALLRALAKAWVVTGDVRYRERGRELAGRIARELRGGDRPLFADQEGYVIEAVLHSAATFGDAAAERRATMALDGVLQRMYARGWGVRHAAAGSVHRLLQDQVQVAAACLAAHHASGDRRYLDVARDLAAVIERDYGDSLGGYYDRMEPDPAAPALSDRSKPVFDDMLPGGNAWAARMLLRLAEATGDVRYRRRAEAALESIAGAVPGAGIRAAAFLGSAREVLASR
ncbi:MAG: DUF255 domain-containing protein [Gemmatimonadales bacterium]|nr:DUF255 domain-containing protein [Gemmatimonadales bacterium]